MSRTVPRHRSVSADQAPGLCASVQLSPASVVPAYPVAILLAACICRAGSRWPGAFLQRHGKPSSLLRRMYSLMVLLRTRSSSSFNFNLAH